MIKKIAATVAATLSLINFSYAASFELKDGYAITEGDIIIGPANHSLRPGAVVENNQNMRWPNAKLIFDLDANLPASVRAEIFLAIAHYQRYTSIKFVERTDKNKEKYPNYVHFKTGLGCSSYVGMQGGKQVIIINYQCGFGSTVHEIGHALGFWHEQNRLDRDDYVKINIENVIPGYEHNFTQALNHSTNIGKYDFDSIMHYGAYAFSKNGNPTITVLHGKHGIGQRNGLSNGDVAALKEMYQ